MNAIFFIWPDKNNYQQKMANHWKQIQQVIREEKNLNKILKKVIKIINLLKSKIIIIYISFIIKNIIIKN